MQSRIHNAVAFLSRLGDEGASGRSSASDAFGRWLLALGLAAALAFRLYLALSTDFPINDGGLFYDFVRGVGESFPGLPETVRYNGIDIPFAYPPLSFWLGALLTKVGVDAMDVVHYAPIAMNAGYVLLFALLLLRGGHSPLFTGLAVLFLSVILRSFEWLVMGGGLSRGLGSLFFLLALLAAGLPRGGGAAADREPLPMRRSILGGAFIAGALMSHLEWGILAALTFVLARGLAAGRLKEFLASTSVAAFVSLLLILPWLLSVYAVHGLEPFTAASGTSGWSIEGSLVGLILLGLRVFLNPLFLIGGLVVLARRQLFWPAFILLCLFATPRHSGTPITLAISVLSAYGAIAVWRAFSTGDRQRRRFGLALAGAIVPLILVVQAVSEYRNASDGFRPLPLAVREGMHWMRSRHPGAVTAVVTDQPWHYDGSAEWFPTLAGGTSVTTAQGREWLPGNAFETWQGMTAELKASRSCAELLERLNRFGRADFVWAEYREDCFAAPLYRPVFRNERVTIFARSGS